MPLIPACLFLEDNYRLLKSFFVIYSYNFRLWANINMMLLS